MELVKATLRAFDATTHRATVQVSGSIATWLAGVPVARNVPAAEATAGRTCAVLFFDPANPADAVVVAVYE